MLIVLVLMIFYQPSAIPYSASTVAAAFACRAACSSVISSERNPLYVLTISSRDSGPSVTQPEPLSTSSSTLSAASLDRNLRAVPHREQSSASVSSSFSFSLSLSGSSDAALRVKKYSSR